MSFTVETGEGLPDANSYLSVADADSYIADHGDSATWTAASDASKEAALRLATQYLDIRFGGKWLGVRSDSDQSLAWPRNGVDDYDGYVVDWDAVPAAIEDATAELALRVIDGDTLLDDIDEPGTIKSESVTTGPITTKTEYLGGKSQVKRYPLIDGLIRPLISSGGMLERG